MTPTRSADILVQKVLSDSQRVQALATQPESTLKQAAMEAVAQTPLLTDNWIYRLVVGFLGGVAILVVLGLVGKTLFAPQGDVPDGLIALGSAAVGALAGLLAPSPAR